MSFRKLLPGVATLILASLVAGGASAAGLAASSLDQLTGSRLVYPAFFGHFRHTESFYCYPRNYWWFYRPYTTASADDGYERCMPYFHFPPRPYKGQGGSGPIK